MQSEQNSRGATSRASRAVIRSIYSELGIDMKSLPLGVAKRAFRDSSGRLFSDPQQIRLTLIATHNEASRSYAREMAGTFSVDISDAEIIALLHQQGSELLVGNRQNINKLLFDFKPGQATVVAPPPTPEPVKTTFDAFWASLKEDTVQAVVRNVGANEYNNEVYSLESRINDLAHEIDQAIARKLKINSDFILSHETKMASFRDMLEHLYNSPRWKDVHVSCDTNITVCATTVGDVLRSGGLNLGKAQVLIVINTDGNLTLRMLPTANSRLSNGYFLPFVDSRGRVAPTSVSRAVSRNDFKGMLVALETIIWDASSAYLYSNFKAFEAAVPVSSTMLTRTRSNMTYGMYLSNDFTAKLNS